MVNIKTVISTFNIIHYLQYVRHHSYVQCCIPVCRSLKETFRTALVSHTYLFLDCKCTYLFLPQILLCPTWTLPRRVMIMTSCGNLYAGTEHISFVLSGKCSVSVHGTHE